ncbi:adenine nucleotide alpha hydrolase family protein [Roseomonas mucosa]|uniref:hypothetical protein n=1 Tax=Roseomonas mucosa TaxID=207340 RepID=UPI001EF55078|nr:hypothetical protein [Roseomonas mucosa]MCG7353738.1 hypothetical protein [Roseomonas mucosa]
MGPRSTRLLFPQTSADLSVRWCSAALRIGVMDTLIRAQDRFLGSRTLVVTGERAEESPARALYAPSERHRTDTRDGTRRQRHVDHWRPVHGWSERGRVPLRGVGALVLGGLNCRVRQARRRA